MFSQSWRPSGQSIGKNLVPTGDGNYFLLGSETITVRRVIQTNKGDEVVYTGTPELMHEYTKLAIDSGAKIIGGCCGTTCDHLKQMRSAIDNHSKGDRPEVSRIESLIGPMVNKLAAANDAAPKRERRGRRRA